VRGAAISDLHLGYRGAGRIIAGRNAREQDVERAWVAAVDRIVAEQPDLVTIAGDCFHSVRPSFHAVRAWQDGIRRIVRETSAYVVVIGGNHEQPRTAETLSPNVTVAGERRVYVVDSPQRLDLTLANDEEVSVHCFPFTALSAERVYRAEPNPDADVNVLLIHAAVRTSAVRDALPRMYAGETAFDVGGEADRWDVIACGDYHEYTRLHPEHLAFYSGSIERTSSDVWGERAPKGVVLYDTERPDLMRLQPIPTRAMIDLSLAELTGERASAEAVNEALAMLSGMDELADAPLMRLKVDGFPRGERDAIDWRVVEALKSRCTHFLLDLRLEDREARDLGDRRQRVGRSLADEASDFLADESDAVRDLALEYLAGTGA
jgi:DNA repair exonuclease SbcCD nuclease subunit